MSNLKIVIPSHKRHDRVFAKKLVNNPIICVAESQADLYRQYNPECEIVTHPDDVIGLIPKRNWMARHFGDLMMLDDDVHVVKTLFCEKGETGVIRDPDQITHIIESLYELACLLDVHLFGFTSAISPVMYNEWGYYSLSKMITGCAYGVRYNKNVWWNEEIRRSLDFMLHEVQRTPDSYRPPLQLRPEGHVCKCRRAGSVPQSGRGTPLDTVHQKALWGQHQYQRRNQQRQRQDKAARGV